MISQSEPSRPSPASRSKRRRMGWTIRITPTGILVLLLINLLILGGWAYGISQAMGKPGLFGGLFASLLPATSTQSQATSLPPTLTTTNQPTETSTLQPTDTPTPSPVTASPQPIGTLALDQGLILLALNEGGNTHLFAYQPAELGEGQPMPLRRLTYGPWDDINPAISSDGKTIAFASNRSGYWDLYLMDLGSSGITRLTDTLEYDGAPAWSPDSQWLVFETYINDNLELKVQSVSGTGEAIMLTVDPAADFSPAWSPQGRTIAFVSNRSGENEIWLADLDSSEEQRFRNVSRSPATRETHPAWSPDGSALLWVSEEDGIRNLYVNTLLPAGATPTPGAVNRHSLGSGDWPAWSADGEVVLTLLRTPTREYLTAYRVHYPGLALPALELPETLQGLSWGNVSLTTSLEAIYQQAAGLTPTALYEPQVTVQSEANGGRYQLAPLTGVQAPQAYLHDLVDESFTALRLKIASEAGWDFLATLDNAYVPLTAPLGPGMGKDWLYTGRAINLDSVPMNAGWLMAVREDFGLETYWRIYLRPTYQDGSAGIPMHDQPWNFDARYNGDTGDYEQGGAQEATVPEGYWIDFTSRASAYGWQRLPALTQWRISFPAARLNEFAFLESLDWETAMLELYPPEMMITPSPVTPPTDTPTPTLRWYVSPTPTLTPTPRPTFTPVPAIPAAASATPGG